MGGLTHIGNYQIDKELARGGYGEVYKGKHNVLTNRVVAIKILRGTHLEENEERKKFFQEAQLLELLKHPYILSIYDVGLDGNIPYIITEFAPGGSLRQYLHKHGPLLPVEKIITILNQIAQALHYAHQHNVIHRDLKPENILFNAQGHALLADFGLSFLLKNASAQYSASSGTPIYMSPEQFQDVVSKESDQYSLACIAYELFSGKLPFQAPNIWTLRQKHLGEQAVEPHKINSRISPQVSQVILKALAKQRKQRFTNELEFVSALTTAALEQPISEITTKPLSQQTPLFNPDDDFTTLFIKGVQLFEKKQYTDALTIFNHAIQKQSDLADLYFYKGHIFKELKRYKDAVTCYDQAIYRNPNWPRYHNSKGIAFGYLHMFEDAIRAHDQALRLDPNEIVYYFNKAQALKKLQRYDEALYVLEQGRQIAPKYPQLFNLKGNILQQHLKRYQDALEAYEQGLHLSSKDVEMLTGKGLALFNLERFDEALQVYEQALQQKPQDVDLHASKGATLRKLRRYDEALTQLQHTLTLDPQYAYVYYLQGLIFAEQQRHNDALHAFNQAISYGPSELNHYRHKAHLLLRLNRFDEAIHTYDQAIQLNPGEAYLYNLKGEALYAQQKYAEALRAYEQSITLQPQEPKAYLAKANILRKLDQPEQAEYFYKQANRLGYKP